VVIVVKQKLILYLLLLLLLVLLLLYIWYIRTCGGHLQLLLRVVFIIMCILLMSFLSFLGFTFFTQKISLLMCLRSLNVKLRIFLVQTLRYFKRMVVQNSSILDVFFLTLFIKYLALTLLNKTKLSNENITTLWNLTLSSFLIPSSFLNIRIMSFKAWCLSLTDKQSLH
jgi:hypothetical protein